MHFGEDLYFAPLICHRSHLYMLIPGKVHQITYIIALSGQRSIDREYLFFFSRAKIDKTK